MNLSTSEKISSVEWGSPILSINSQCQLLDLSKSSLYWSRPSKETSYNRGGLLELSAGHQEGEKEKDFHGFNCKRLWLLKTGGRLFLAPFHDVGIPPKP